MTLQYILTGVAGLMVGLAIMRVLQSARAAQPEPAAKGAADAPTADAPAAGQDPSAVRRRFPAMPTSRLLLLGSVVIAAMAAAIMALSPVEQDLPALAAGPMATGAPGGAQSLDDVDTMIGRLSSRLKDDPNDGEGFRMLGWSYAMTGHPDKALEPYRRALDLLPDNASVHAGYAEALVGVAGGKVTDQARAQFRKAQELDPAEPRTRYFLAMWQAQNGKGREALEDWIALANSGPADAPWQADVRRQIAEVSTRLKIDVSGRLKQQAPASPPSAGAEMPVLDPAAMQAANAMPAADRSAMISGMVEGLAARLAASPRDAGGWARLLRSRMVLGQAEQAAKDLADARAALADDAAGLAAVNAAAREAGVPGA